MNTDLTMSHDVGLLQRTYAMGPDKLPFPTPLIEDLSLRDIMKNKHVKELYDKFIQATTNVASLVDDLSKTNKELRDLRNEYDEMKTRYFEVLHDQTTQQNGAVTS